MLSENVTGPGFKSRLSPRILIFAVFAFFAFAGAECWLDGLLSRLFFRRVLSYLCRVFSTWCLFMAVGRRPPGVLIDSCPGTAKRQSMPLAKVSCSSAVIQLRKAP